MSKIWKNIKEYNIISTPLSVSQLQNIQLKPNKLIISSPINEDGEDDTNNVNLIITDNDGNPLNITNNTTLYNMCYAIGEILKFQSDNSKYFSFTVDKSELRNKYIYKNNSLSESTVDNFSMSYSNCIDINMYVDNPILNEKINFNHSDLEDNTVTIKNITVNPQIDNSVDTGLYISYVKLDTDIPNINKSIKVSNVVIKDNFYIYYGLVSNNVSHALRNSTINNGYSKFINDDYLSNGINLTNEQSTFLKEISTCHANKYVSAHVSNFSKESCIYDAYTSNVLTNVEPNTYISLNNGMTISNIVKNQLNYLNINDSLITYYSLKGVSTAYLNEYTYYNNVDIDKVYEYYKKYNVYNIPSAMNLWIIVPSILTYYYNYNNFKLYLTNTNNQDSIIEYAVHDSHKFIHDNKDYYYIEFGKTKSNVTYEGLSYDIITSYTAKILIN